MKFPKSLTTHFSMVLRLKKFNRLPVIVICLLLITGGPSMVRAEGEGDIVEQAGLGVASVILTIPYGFDELLTNCFLLFCFFFGGVCCGPQFLP